MADLLTHVLVAYAIGTLLSLRYTWLTPRYVTIVMMGALLPDLNRLSLVVDDYWMEMYLGMPFTWFGFHTLGGVVIVSAIGGVLAGDEHRRRVVALLLLGALSHLVLDALLFLPSGYSAPMWWPVTEQRLPTPGWYMSYHRWPVVLAGAIAAAAWGLRRRVT